MKHISISSSGAVRCRAALDLPLSLTGVWGQIRDFDTFAKLDLFHTAIRIEGGVARQGTALDIQHRYGLFAVRRVGRILVWKENFGYSFSDLSKRGPGKGFPHVFSYRLESTGEQTCRLHVTVTGRWTAGFIPKSFARLWLWWVFRQVVRGVQQQLLIYQIWRKRNARVKQLVMLLILTMLCRISDDTKRSSFRHKALDLSSAHASHPGRPHVARHGSAQAASV